MLTLSLKLQDNYAPIAKRSLLWSFLAVCLLIGCGGAPQAVMKHPIGTPEYYPFSRQVTFIESSSTTRTMLRTTGRGIDLASSMLDARKAGLWFLLYAGDRPLLKKSMAKNGRGSLEQQLFEQVSVYIRYESSLKSKQIIAGETRTQLVIGYDVTSIKKTLSQEGVLESTEEVSETVGLPTIGVVGVNKSRANRAAVGTVREYLQDRDFDVFDLSKATVRDRAISRLAEIDGIIDPSFGPALDSATDILIRVDASVSNGRTHGIPTSKGTVSISAFDVASGSSLGASSGRSPARAGVKDDGAVAAEAANDAADKVTQQILKGWSKQTRRGRAFKVVVMAPLNSINDVDGTMYDSLRRLAKKGRRVKRTGSGQGIATFIVYADPAKFPNAYELFSHIERSWSGSSRLTRIKDAGGLLILKAGAGAPGIEL